MLWRRPAPADLSDLVLVRHTCGRGPIRWRLYRDDGRTISGAARSVRGARRAAARAAGLDLGPACIVVPSPANNDLPA